MLKTFLTVIAVLFSLLVFTVLFFGTGCACSTKEMAYAAAMKSDLRNLVTAQEMAFERDSTWHASLDSLDYVPSHSVSITIVSVSGTGWFAHAGHQLTHSRCGIYVGPVPQDTTFQWKEEAVPVCRDVPPRRGSPFDRLVGLFR